MIRKIFLLSWLLSSLLISDLVSQSKADIKEVFYDAESWILFEDYKEALPKYRQLLQFYPDNANYKYRIGQCLINTPGEKEKAISYLEDAIKNINPKYRAGKFSEAGAPFDALYYLANAYRINNQLDKALGIYELFKKDLNTEVYDSTIVNLQIQSCLNAKNLMSTPVFIKEKNLGGNINRTTSEFNPVISDNEDMLVFSRSEAFYDAILYSTRTNGQWNTPLNMNELLKVDRDLFPTSLSGDGKTLYLYSSAEYDGNIYTTHFENGIWSQIIKLNENINTKFWESHATVSHDNKSLYFTSNRKGTLGGLDIYVSKRDSTGEWGPATNLGPVINTPYNEESPFLSLDDRTLFFSSRGHYNIGGYDVFYSSLLNNGEWSLPLNAGYPLNSTDDDLFYAPINDGYEGYFTKDSPEGFGKQDIYRIEIFNNDHPRNFYVRGIAKVADLLSNFRDSVKISATDIKTSTRKVVVYTDTKTGEFELQLPQGNYQIAYEAADSKKNIRDLDLPLSLPSDSIYLPVTILSKTDYIAGLTVESNRTISVSNGDSILFPLKAEPNSLLDIEHRVGDSLISVEHFSIRDSAFNYKIKPRNGDNKVVFSLTDRFNNSTRAEVLIKREKDLAEQHIKRSGYSRISHEDLNKIAEVIIAEPDLSLAILREKIMIYSEYSENGSIIRQSVTSADILNINTSGEWLQNFYNESAARGIKYNKQAEMFVILSSLPEVSVEQFLTDFIHLTEEPLFSSLKSLDLKKENIKSKSDLILHLLMNKGRYPEEKVFKSIAAIITTREIISEDIKKQLIKGKSKGSWIIWIVAGTGLFLFLLKYRKKQESQKK